MEIAATLYKYMDMNTKTVKEADFSNIALDVVKLFAIPAVVGRSEQLVCPYCKGKNIEIRHREQSFRCVDCKEGWAN